MNRYTQKFDLFSENFQFTIGKYYKKKTRFGGILSIILFILFSAYFIYLSYRYINNSFIPRINTKTMNEIERIEYTILDDFLYFEIMIGGITLGEYEKQVGKKYINYKLIYEQYQNDGSLKQFEIPTKVCNNQNLFPNYRCIDHDNFDKDIIIMTDNIHLIQNDLALQIQRCTGITECATIDEIDDLILNPLNYFQTFLRLEQYNSITQKFEVSYKADYYFFDIDIVQQTTFTIKKAMTEVHTGLFIQHRETIDHLIGYIQNSRYFTKRKLEYRQGITSYAEFYFELSQGVQFSVIQMPMITYILSQFLSVVNPILAIGIIAQYFGKSIMLKQFACLILKEYYKNSAIEIIKNDEEKQQNNSDQNSLNILENINKNHDKIENFDYVKDMEEHNNSGIFNKIKFILNNKLTRKDQNKESIIYDQVLNEAKNQIDIYEMLKDFMQMKKAFKMQLSEQQYAALKYCGSSFHFKQDKDENSIQSILQNKNKNVNQLEVDLENNQNQKIQKIEKNQVAPLKTENMIQSQGQVSTFTKFDLTNKENVKIQNRGGKLSCSLIDEKKSQYSNQEKNSLSEFNQNKSIKESFDFELQSNHNNQQIYMIKQENIEKKEMDENHFYKLDQIHKSSDKCKQYFKMFLDKFKDQKQISDLDKRIFTSIFKQKPI